MRRTPARAGEGRNLRSSPRRRGLEDIAICGLLFHGGLRRSEIAALKWQDVQPAEDCPGALLVRVRGSKTDQTAARADVRLVKDRYAAALESIRPRHSDPALPVFDGLSAQSIARRFTQAAKAAGIEGRITAHCGRVSLASELTRRGASAIDTMLAGGWTTSRMVAPLRLRRNRQPRRGRAVSLNWIVLDSRNHRRLNRKKWRRARPFHT